MPKRRLEIAVYPPFIFYAGAMSIDNCLADFSFGHQALQAILEQMPTGIIIAEVPGGRILYHNREAERLLDHSLANIDCLEEYRSRFAAIHEDGTPYTLEDYPLVRSLRGERIASEEMLYRRGDGSVTTLHVQSSPINDAAGQPLMAVGAFFDIAERKRAEAKLHDTETKLRLAIDIGGLGFWEWDVRTDEVFFSPQWKRHLGYKDDELQHRFEEWRSRVHPDDAPHVMEKLGHHLQSEEDDYRVQFRFRHRDGSWRWIEARALTMRDEHGRPLRMVGTHIDITDHKEREEHVRMVAQHDRLTGLPNRALTYELAGHCLAALRRMGSMCAVMFIDLDGFKPINDAWGHHIGDEVLKEVAQRLRNSFRSQDVVGRLGGDEFLVVATQLNSALDAVHAASHAVQQLSMPYHVGDLVLNTSPSIGISLCPRDGDEIAMLVRLADAAMYDAKQNGKASYRFSDVSRHFEPGTVQLPARLRESMARREELQLHFQPMVNLQTQRLMAAEALLRWSAPDGRPMSPDMCIALAEQSGFIGELGEWILESACVQYAEWLRQGLPQISIGINLSANQLREGRMQEAIARMLQDGRIPADKLWVEVSDRAFNGAPQYALASLQQLKALGVRVTLDDFGVGYMTLEQLSRLPLDRVKIDRSLIAALPADKPSIAVTEAVISFGKSLGIEVVAEGLESDLVRGFLQERQCHCVQGFHVAPPMSGAHFADWYRRTGLS
jgi:diguanylate cyclase (GGDEF)-like protein/PAS domain S-box-containing protein